ncbi:MAG: 4Fe-4S dicluster domain-containing protein [Chloroflexi bacterium]|nr:4Fe-4S dicluster domain-containing protein [Chloroflexota bacterium]
MFPEKAVLSAPVDPGFLRKVREESGEDPSRCYQCLRCSTGCPLSSNMDYTPHQVMRLIQLGQKDEVLGSDAIWVCVSCYTCSVRCPNDINIAHLYDTLRQMAVREGYEIKRSQIPIFHREFLGQVKYLGRLHELMLMGFYRLRAGGLFDDMDLGYDMVRKGRLGLLPSFPHGGKDLKRIYDYAGKEAKTS